MKIQSYEKNFCFKLKKIIKGNGPVYKLREIVNIKEWCRDLLVFNSIFYLLSYCLRHHYCHSSCNISDSFSLLQHHSIITNSFSLFLLYLVLFPYNKSPLDFSELKTEWSRKKKMTYFIWYTFTKTGIFLAKKLTEFSMFTWIKILRGSVFCLKFCFFIQLDSQTNQ